MATTSYAAQDGEHHALKVAVIEDDTAICTFLADAVSERGHATASFPTAEAAWQRFQTEPYALLLVDWMLPGMDGLELCRRVRQLPWGGDALIIVLTARGGAADLAEALDAGADDFLSKPFHLALLDVRLSIAERQVAVRRARREAEEALRQSQARFRFQADLLDTVGQAVAATDLQGIVTYWNRASEGLYGWSAAEAVGRPIMEVLPAPSSQDLVQVIFAHMAIGQAWSGEQLHRHRDGRIFPAAVTATPVFDEQGAVIGGVSISADITAQKEAEAAVQRHLDLLSALRAVDVAVTASLDLRLTLGVVLDQLIVHLRVDGAGVLLLNSHTRVLEYAVGRGHRGRAVTRSSLQLGEGLAGRAALERRSLSIPDLATSSEHFERRQMRDEEGIVAYFAVPLVAKGHINGVLELWHRTPLTPTLEWLEFLQALAGQATIAVDSAALFDGLQRSNMELGLAYDATIEGWSRALDLRDKETEGHSQRVTAMTLALAQAMGMSDVELVHLRRGALLHDIGKLGVPDHILLKPGPLTEEEWAIMREHPVHAFNLLLPIPYLRPALDIPYRHHEKWDGSGYPLGIAGEQIPRAARIFAVVDVWDALSSDRPYRPAWAQEQVREHIRSQAGSDFDPAVVEAFLALLEARV